ncbi:dienelactone hydrolase family protein [Aquabacter spiritensis]|uniref:Carboxymethylenebutenolidase n=1 Tax=Aquabacter spiritensis TaxID=933073 RepID=A0A4R3M3T9_9HYPH|nr:dienelactone hydrolase family protein [Aquabacter spiritensis]TCT07880.1 carboxymethylenebutenolidase [Aquabacter spiritensis]
MIALSAADGHTFSAYRADPPDAPKGAVVVLQEVFGVTPHIRRVTDAFAALGYLAIAPALFDRVRTCVELGHDEEGFLEGLTLVEKIGDATALADIQASVDAVKGAGKVAVVGFSWGGHLAYLAANEVAGLACSIGYYGAGIVEEGGAKRKVPTLLHFGSADSLIPLDRVTQFREDRPDVSAFAYPGATHGFDTAPRGPLNVAAASAAQERTCAWIAQYVEGQPPIALKNAGAYAQAKVDKKKGKKAGDDLAPPID